MPACTCRLLCCFVFVCSRSRRIRACTRLEPRSCVCVCVFRGFARMSNKNIFFIRRLIRLICNVIYCGDILAFSSRFSYSKCVNIKHRSLQLSQRYLSGWLVSPPNLQNDLNRDTPKQSTATEQRAAHSLRTRPTHSQRNTSTTAWSVAFETHGTPPRMTSTREFNPKIVLCINLVSAGAGAGAGSLLSHVCVIKERVFHNRCTRNYLRHLQHLSRAHGLTRSHIHTIIL